MVFCTSCGNSVPGGARFCTSCGTPSSAPNSPQSASRSPQTTQKSSPQPAKKWGSPSSPSTPTYNVDGVVRSTPKVAAITTGRAATNTSYAAGLDNSYQSGNHKNDYKVTYEKQPDWAFAEQHKNSHGQYKTGQFRHVNL